MLWSNAPEFAQIMLHEFNISFLLSYLNDEIMSISSLFSSSTVSLSHNQHFIYVHIDYICVSTFLLYT